MQFSINISAIQKMLKHPLPGEEAQYLLAPKERKSKLEYLTENINPKLSSVLILLYPGEKGELKTVFIQRPINKSVHSGQIAFPGGKFDETDMDLSATALRETNEEIGVNPFDIEVIGTLSELYIPASNFLVHPFVGKLEFTPEFIPNPEEVKSILPATIEEILAFETGHMPFKTAYGNLIAPYFKFQEHAMWGATAMIVSEFREIMKRIF